MTTQEELQADLDPSPTLREVANRVWDARNELRRTRVHVGLFKVYVSRRTWEAMVMEAQEQPGFTLPGQGPATIFGLDCLPDDSLLPDAVVLRIEVPA